jgi:membrane protease YdiL (CAAX protease family)
MSLIQQLKRRNVIRVAIAYCVVGWLVLQMAHIAAPALGFPGWTYQTLLLIGVFGFPLVLLFAWTFELTPGGLKRTEQVQPTESIAEETRATLTKVIIFLLALALVLVIAESYFPLLEHSSPQPPAQDSL